jgi:hypothetical protein
VANLLLARTVSQDWRRVILLETKLLIFSSLSTDTKPSYRFQVTGFYEALQLTESRNSIELELTSQIVVAAIGAAHGVKFSLPETTQLNSHRCVPSRLAHGSRIQYYCPNRRNSHSSKPPITKPQRIRTRRERFDCGGKINVYFPDCEADSTFDFGIEYEHTAHDDATRVGNEGMVKSSLSTC